MSVILSSGDRKEVKVELRCDWTQHYVMLYGPENLSYDCTNKIVVEGDTLMQVLKGIVSLSEREGWQFLRQDLCAYHRRDL